MTNHKVKCSDFEIANDQPFTLIAGPCQLENETHAIKMSAELKAQHNFKSRISLSENIPLSTPLVIYVEVSSFCNLSCGFCPQHLSPNEVPKNKMHLERFEEMCRQIKKFPELPNFILDFLSLEF